MACHGNGPDHCCYLNGPACPYLEVDTVPGRHWVCGLRREFGSWEAVHVDDRYLENVKPVWLEHGVADCGDFGPAVQQCCFSETWVEVH